MDTTELTRRALEVCKRLNLVDMKEAGYYTPNEDAPFSGFEVQRFMVYEKSAGGCGWVHFFDKRQDAEIEIADLAHNEHYRLDSVFDLQRDDYGKPLSVFVKAEIREPVR